MVLIRINPDATRDDLVTCILHYCDRAKFMSRQGRKGTDTEPYRDLHDTLDALVDAILMMDSVPA